ncbi:MAG: hypothetical protein HFH82_10490 [Lachnospiraceae bacterium]|nr:hypothetical protein [Lachnospiraceae bacterium]
MRYQIRYANALQMIYDRDPSWKELAIHFAENGYDPLYVHKNGYISYVVTFQDFSTRTIHTSLNRGFIKAYSDNIQSADIEKAFLEDLDAERIIYLKDGKVICEVNALIELSLQNSIAKNLMALRYVRIFHSELSAYLEQYSSILILAEYDVFSYLQTLFAEKHMVYAGSIEQAVSIVKEQNIDICFDFMFNKKFRMILAPEIKNVVELCKVITPAALRKLIDLTDQRDVSLFFYKLPRYQDLSCLHEREEDNFHNRKTIGQLIRDNTYLDLFTREENEKKYLRDKEFHASQRLDNGYCFVMDEVTSHSHNVHNGIRNNGCDECKGSIANFYGPCTAYGFLVEDKLTVPGIIQRYAIEAGKRIRTHNRAGIHGFNELNSIMEALMVPVTNGDMHVFLDVLEDLPYDSYPRITFVKDWFNEDKTMEEVQFLDFPGHCNSDANKIMARHIFEELVNRHQCEGEKTAIRKPLLTDSFDPLENISITHASFVKQRRILDKYSIDKDRNGAIGALVITGKEELRFGKELVNDCLLQSDFLYVFFVNTNVKSIDENKKLYDYVCSLDSGKVKGIPLEYFFYVDRYCDGKDNRYECMEQALFTQRAFFKLLNDELCVNIYFYPEGISDDYYNDILKPASSKQDCNLRIIKCKEPKINESSMV